MIHCQQTRAEGCRERQGCGGNTLETSVPRREWRVGRGGREGGGKDEVKREGQRGKEEVGNLYLYLPTRSLSHLNDIAFVV